MDESGCAFRLCHKSRVIVLAKEKDAIKSMNGKREWETNIDSISKIRKASKAFIITKSKYVLRDLIKPIIESGCTLTVTHNGWSNDEMVMAYIRVQIVNIGRARQSRNLPVQAIRL
jgi:hypothetical protein